MKKNNFYKTFTFVILLSITSIYSCGKIQKKDIKTTGGLKMVLQVSGKDFLQQLSNKSKNFVLKKAISLTDKKQDNELSYLQYFFQNFDSINKATKDSVKLSDIDVFGFMSDTIIQNM